MSNKIGLVIQGALTSIGRTGDKLHQTPGQLMKDGGVIEFDCRENIQRIIDQYGHLFSEIVVSVFDNQLKPGDAWRGAKIVSGPDPGGIKQVGHYKDNNKARQFISTLNGILELEKSGVDYVVKTRTDTFLDFEKLLESFFANDASKIGCTVAHSPSLLLHDLYFVARTDLLKRFCEAILAFDRFEFISSVHRDMLLKHAYSEYRDKIGAPDWAYFPIFPPDGIGRETRQVFNYMFNNVYFSLDEGVWRETLWRGTYFSPDHFESLVGKAHKSRSYNLPSFITIDWERYFEFKNRNFKVHSPIYRRFLILVAGVLWWAWNYLRKVVRLFK